MQRGKERGGEMGEFGIGNKGRGNGLASSSVTLCDRTALCAVSFWGQTETVRNYNNSSSDSSNSQPAIVESIDPQ